MCSLQVQKEALARSYANKKFEQPYQTALYTASVIYEVKRWHISEYEAVIGDLTLQDLQVCNIARHREFVMLLQHLVPAIILV